MIILGSKALSFYSKDKDNTSDFDLVMSIDDFKSWHNKYEKFIIESYPTYSYKYNVIVEKNNNKYHYEIEFDSQSSSKWLLKNKELFKNTMTDILGDNYIVPSLEYLLLTKRSHLMFPVHIDKNMKYYSDIKQLVGDFVLDFKMQEYYHLRHNEANQRFLEKHKTRNLNVSNNDFFNNPIVKPLQVLEHDTLHEIVKHRDTPIYEKMKFENKMDLAWCEESLFVKLSKEMKIESVLEESYVIALERFIIPGFKDDLFDAFKTSLNKVCTTLCSGWFRDFAIENYDEVIMNYNDDFFMKYKNYIK